MVISCRYNKKLTSTIRKSRMLSILLCKIFQFGFHRSQEYSEGPTRLKTTNSVWLSHLITESWNCYSWCYPALHTQINCRKSNRSNHNILKSEGTKKVGIMCLLCLESLNPFTDKDSLLFILWLDITNWLKNV